MPKAYRRAPKRTGKKRKKAFTSAPYVTEKGKSYPHAIKRAVNKARKARKTKRVRDLQAERAARKLATRRRKAAGIKSQVGLTEKGKRVGYRKLKMSKKPFLTRGARRAGKPIAARRAVKRLGARSKRFGRGTRA